jgi:hypothetical protein
MTCFARLSAFLLACTIALFGALSPSVALADGIACFPKDVFEDTDNGNVAVQCTTPQNGVDFIFLTSADAPRAQRFISMATAALLSGKAFFVWTDDVSKPVGCGAGCARAVQFGITK